jgi:hypothetical protein
MGQMSLRFLFMATILFGALLAPALPSSMPSLPKVIGPIPVTADSQVFGAEDVPGGPASANLPAHGYVEEEYFVSGTANIYQYDSNWNRTLKQANVPYTTRMVIRRPTDRTKFSGTVQYECGHPQMGNTGNWNATKDYILRHGDIYIGVMCGADLITRRTSATAPPTGAPFVLKWFDAKRYAQIDWPEDDGIRYDVIAQAGALLKSKDKSNPLAAYNVQRIYCAGWSFTGSLWRVYINEGFHDEYRMPNGSPIFDGYLLGISSSTFSGGYDPLNNDQNLPVGNPRRVTKSVDVPVIEQMSENEAITNFGPQAPESDDLKSRHRLYEVPGLTHGNGLGSGVNGMRFQLTQHGYPAAGASGGAARGDVSAACRPTPSDVPMGDIAIASLSNMDAWARKNIPPPHAPRMEIDPATKLGHKDAYGNTEGGVRTAQLDVPLARYGENLDPACTVQRPQLPAGSGFISVSRFPLSKEQLAALYTSKDDYLSKFKKQLDEMVKDHWLLQPEADKQFEAAKVNAAAAFK